MKKKKTISRRSFLEKSGYGGATYTLRVSHKFYNFNPNERIFTAFDNLDNLDFFSTD